MHRIVFADMRVCVIGWVHGRAMHVYMYSMCIGCLYVYVLACIHVYLLYMHIIVQYIIRKEDMHIVKFIHTHSVNSPAVSTEAVGFVGGTVLEVVGKTVPEETTSVAPAI